MVVKKMKLAAKSILTNNNSKKMGIFEIGFGQQYAVFAKDIIDKYAKILNYHFEYTALVFLEQMTEMKRGQQTSTNVINLTWSLLSFLFKEGKSNLAINQENFVMHQITKQIEDHLEQIKREELPVYRDLARCYALYQKIYKEKADNGNITESEKLEETIRYIEKQAQQRIPFQKRENKGKITIIPGTMNKAFFYNLNHAMKENKIMSYRQIWKQSVKQQLDQYYLDICMKAFIQERQIDRKQEFFNNIFQSFDENTVQTYLMKSDKNIYTQFVEYMMTVIDTNNIVKKTDKIIKSDKIGSSKRESNIEREINIYDKERIIEQKQRISKEKEIELRERIEEYKNIHNDIMEILGETQEITRNIIIEKSKEYKELFYEYIQSENEQYEDVKMIQDIKNPQIFSSNDIELLLKEENVKRKETYTEEVQQKITFLKEKLNLLAIREVIERCLTEDTGILHREKIISIAHILENVDFQSNSDNMETASRMEYETDILSDLVKERQDGQEGVQTNILQQVIQDNLGNEKVNTAEIENVNIVFEKGTLPERKLLYLAIQEGIDEVFTEKKENKNSQKEILELKNKIVQEEDYKKRSIGDWRFLMKKNRSMEIVKAMEELPKQEKRWLEEKLEKKIQGFQQVQREIYRFYELSKETDKSLYDVYEEHKSIWREWSSVFSKEEMIQMQEETQEKIQKKNQERIQEKMQESDLLKERHNDQEAMQKNILQQLIQGNLENSSQKLIQDNLGNRKVNIAEIENVNVVFEKGTLPERKLLYLAIQEGIDEVFTKKKENKNLQKEILELKRKIIQEDDEKKRSIGDWHFLMRKNRSMEIIKAIEELPKQEKRWLEEKLVKKIQNFQQVQREIYRFYELSQETNKSLQDIYEEHKPIWREWSSVFSKEEMIEMQEKIQERIQKEEKSNINQKMLIEKNRAEWISNFKKEELTTILPRLQIKLQKGTIEEIEEVLSEEKIAERKLIFLLMQTEINEEIIKSGINSNKWKNREKLISMMKELVSIRSEEEIADENWNFLMETNQKNKMVHILHTMNADLQDKFLSNVKKCIKEMTILSEIEKSIEEVREDSVENVEGKLKTTPQYVKMLYNIKRDKEESYNFTQYLRRRQRYNNPMEEFGNIRPITQRNLHFMEPPVHDLDRVHQVEISEQLRYQERGMQIILNHTNNKKINIQEKKQDIVTEKQEGVIKELERGILECQLELESKNKRMDMLEKNIKNQEENIQFLKNKQDSMVRQINSRIEAKKVLNLIKDELQLEQMRRGRL